MTSRDRLAAWLVTGPAGHLWSAAADIVVLWVRYGWARATRRAPPRWSPRRVRGRS